MKINMKSGISITRYKKSTFQINTQFHPDACSQTLLSYNSVKLGITKTKSATANWGKR